MTLLKVLSASTHSKHDNVNVFSIDLTAACAKQVNANKERLLGREMASRLDCKQGDIFAYHPDEIPSTVRAVSCTFVQSTELYLSAWLLISSISSCEVVMCDQVMCDTLAEAFTMHTIHGRQSKAASWAAELYRFDSFILNATLGIYLNHLNPFQVIPVSFCFASYLILLLIQVNHLPICTHTHSSGRDYQ